MQDTVEMSEICNCNAQRKNSEHETEIIFEGIILENFQN